MSTRFDRDYYRRFYYDSRTAVTSRAEMRARARLIGAYADHIGLPVRRMLDAVGHPVTRLIRTRIGPLSDRRLPPGEWRELTPAELRAMEAAVGAAGRSQSGSPDPGR